MTKQLLRRIIPWSLESNASNLEYRGNYKGVRGRIGIVGGARDYAGAPYFASISAMRLGADLSYVICSQSASQAIKTYSPDLIVVPILDCAEENEFRAEMKCLITRLHALVIGPGLGRESLLQDRARILIQEAKLRSMPLILDADSLMLVNDDPELIKSYPNALLTPNRVELQRMWNSLNKDKKQLDLREMNTSQIRELVADCANKLQVTILAKGNVDIIDCQGKVECQAVTDERLGSNRRCGGQGDILAGIAGVYAHWLGQPRDQTKSESKMQSSQSSNECDNNEPARQSRRREMLLAGYLAAVTTRKCNELAYKDFRNGMLASHMIDRIHVALDELMTVDGVGTLICDDKCSPDEHDRSAMDSSHNSQPEETQTGATVSRSKTVRNAAYSGSLSLDEINRYRRQMIMDEFGPEAQVRLKSSSVLVIGAGGLGCPASIYLAAAGIGKLGIVDHDRVELSNLHRQILHNTDKLGWLKVDSIERELRAVNDNLKVRTHPIRLDRFNAVDLIESYDVILDCTDNLASRYLISDACVVAAKPLVSGAALKMDGQLTVYNYSPDTPCFRCLFPVAPSAAATGSCADNGVLGPIPGLIGLLQALEAVKLAAGLAPANAGKMLLFDGQLGRFRHVTLCKRRADCQACGKDSKLDRKLIDYETFCALSSCQADQTSGSGLTPQSSILDDSERLSVDDYKDLLESGQPHVLVDVRPSSHSQVARFAHAIQVPLADMMSQPEATSGRISSQLERQQSELLVVVCRRGIASQRGVRLLQDLLSDSKIVVKDVRGGMTEWARKVDPQSFSCL